MQMRLRPLTMGMTQDETVPETYAIQLDIPDFAPGPRLRGWMGSAESLPDTFGALQMDMGVRFDRPWDRRALDERRPQPQRIDLRLAEVDRCTLAHSIDDTPVDLYRT